VIVPTPISSQMAAALPQRGGAYQPRARPWVNQGPRSPRSEGTPHPDARPALAPSTSLLPSFRTHGLAVKPPPGPCPGLVCHAPLGHPWMPATRERATPQAIAPRRRLTSRSPSAAPVLCGQIARPPQRGADPERQRRALRQPRARPWVFPAPKAFKPCRGDPTRIPAGSPEPKTHRKPQTLLGHRHLIAPIGARRAPPAHPTA
jgi:hypothetical protein